MITCKLNDVTRVGYCVSEAKVSCKLSYKHNKLIICNKIMFIVYFKTREYICRESGLAPCVRWYDLRLGYE